MIAHRFATRAVHLGVEELDGRSQPVADPIFQTASFAFASSESLEHAVNERGYAYSYSRLENPNTDAFARTVANLESADAGVAFASGMAAMHAALLAHLRTGEHVVAARALYGSTFALLSDSFRRLGVETSFVDVGNLSAVVAAMCARTRVVLCETISNPTLSVSNLPELARVAHRRGAMLIVDNTFATPVLCRPIEHGADLVVHSATKYLGGHGDLLAGVVVGARKHLQPVQQVAIDTGGVCAPIVAWLALRGLRTLPLRVERQSASAAALARFLSQQPRVKAVLYPHLETHLQYALAKQLLAAGGGVLSFVLEGGAAAARRVLDALRLFRRAGSLGDVHSLALHPASTSHRQLSVRERSEAGIGAGLVRLSVGLEDVDDLQDDLTGALETVG